MKKNVLTIFTSILLMVTTNSFAPSTVVEIPPVEVKTLLYDGVWGTIYHAETRQCDNTPLKTGDGSTIDPYNASDHRWIAITHYMLKDEWRRGLALKRDSTDARFNGKIEYGDTVLIESPYPELNGLWIVKDTKNKRYEKPTIDFLQTKNDGSLYGNNKMWSGKWNNIKIYKYDGRI